MTTAATRAPDTDPNATTHDVSDGQKIFLLACLDAWRDGRIDPEENDLLRRLHPALGLHPDEARKIAEVARARAGTPRSMTPDPLSPARVYLAAARLMHRHGEPDNAQRRLLVTLATVLKLDGRTRRRIERTLVPEVAPSATPPPAATVASPRSASEPPPAPPCSSPLARRPARSASAATPPRAAVGAGKDAGASGKKSHGDSGGREDAMDLGEAFGDPAGWDFFRPLTLALEVTVRHPCYWMTLAVLVLVAGWIPVVSLLVPAAGTIIAIGAAVDMLQGEADPEVGRTWERWRERLWPAFWVSFLIGFLVLGTAALTAASLAVSQSFAWRLLVVVGAVLAGLALFRAVIFATQEVVLAGRGGLEAIQGSFTLAHRNILPVIGMCLVIGGFWVATVTLVGVAFVPVLATVGKGSSGGLVFLGLRAALAMAIQLVGQMGTVAWTYLYLRERARAQA